jgi:hypothetical protein
VGCVEVDDPGTQGFVDGVAKGAGTSFNGDDLGAEELDAEDIEGLASYVFLKKLSELNDSGRRFVTHRSHVNRALHAELGANCGGCYTMLSSSCLGNDFSFP